MKEYGLKRPSLGPLELKHKQGKTPVLDLGALGKIKSGEIKVVPGIKRLLHGGVELVDGRVIDVDSVVLATGYRSNVPSWLQASRTLIVTTELLHIFLSFGRLDWSIECLQDTDCFNENGFPKQPFPNGWKGNTGLYAVGFTRRGLAGASHDAAKVAEDIVRVWRDETKQAKHIIACHRRCISQI
ncbi:hypothetical protein BHE74_00059176 [Ensete ventricosum]|uniref:indole-3-pyruvate monooxygenase n=1 Tax=Ensete ventricosum TaxID=4639 RepID=A0A445MMA2_ENSVE|nr:hypothetical protein BHE74_00059176 [Ensete ventricosum]RZR75366.1 hypothetical protein BHM03_00055701 [Ensete ventricosum]